MNLNPFQVVCPVCRSELRATRPDQLLCASCGMAYGYENGIPDLIEGPRFPDSIDAERNSYEERANEHTARHYLLPVFHRLAGGAAWPARILSVGCGTAVDVDVLNRAGFDAAGIDCGNRRDVWPRREFSDRLYLANGQRLPFQNGTFDIAYCGCVFPHVGVEGDSNRVVPDYRDERLAVAREMVRVVKPGGHILVSSPNRSCPVDLFHGRSKKRPLPRINAPTSRFLLSPADYRGLFEEAGCDCFHLLPVEGYWGFVNRRTTRRGRLLAWPVKTAFRLVSSERLRFARGWAINPWLVMLMRKARR